MNRSIFTKYCMGCVAMTFLVYGLFAASDDRRLFADPLEAGTTSKVSRVNWQIGDPDNGDKASYGFKEDAAVAAAKSLSYAFRSVSKRILPTIVAIDNSPQLQPGQPAWGLSPYGLSPSLQNPFGGGPLNSLPGMRPSRTPQQSGVGSGVIVDGSGLILTNNHVVQGNGIITARLHDGREFKADQVWTDPKTDVALIKIQVDERLPVATIGDSDETQVGDWVLAMGQPFGLESTVTAGIISAKSRTMGIMDREDFLQTDAAINPGNSGGPLVDLDGRIVGINTAISSRGGGNDGVGFAVPINLAKWVADELVDDGIVQRAYLGVGIQAVTQPLADQFNLPPRTGLLITQVMPGSPAQQAGVRDGDILVEFDGDEVNSAHRLQMKVERSKIGQRYGLVVLREGRRLELECVAQQAKVRPVNRLGFSTGSQTEPTAYDDLGLQVESMDSDIAQRLNLSDLQGVVITGVQSDSPAASSGLKIGMVLATVNQYQVDSAEDFRNAVIEADLEDGILFLARTSQGSRFIVVRK